MGGVRQSEYVFYLGFSASPDGRASAEMSCIRKAPLRDICGVGAHSLIGHMSCLLYGSEVRLYILVRNATVASRYAKTVGL